MTRRPEVGLPPPQVTAQLLNGSKVRCPWKDLWGDFLIWKNICPAVEGVHGSEQRPGISALDSVLTLPPTHCGMRGVASGSTCPSGQWERETPLGWRPEGRARPGSRTGSVLIENTCMDVIKRIVCCHSCLLSNEGPVLPVRSHFCSLCRGVIGAASQLWAGCSSPATGVSPCAGRSPARTREDTPRTPGRRVVLTLQGDELGAGRGQGRESAPGTPGWRGRQSIYSAGFRSISRALGCGEYASSLGRLRKRGRKGSCLEPTLTGSLPGPQMQTFWPEGISSHTQLAHSARWINRGLQFSLCGCSVVSGSSALPGGIRNPLMT